MTDAESMPAADSAPAADSMPAADALARVEAALEALRAGKPALVLDDKSRENEADVILAAQTLTPQWLGWAIRHTSGYLCAPMTSTRAEQLGLPLMVPESQDPLRTAYTVSVDAAAGIGTGISATDRARTIGVLGDREATAADLIRPGHVLPLRARDGGVLERAGHTEATVDLCRLAGLSPVGAIGELVDDEGEMLRGASVQALAREFALPVLHIADLVAWRRRYDRVERVTTTQLPTEHGTFRAVGYRDTLTGAEHIALVADGPSATPLVRVHSECLTGDALGSHRCDCGPQLQHAMRQVATEGGAIVYLRGHEGRGIGLLDKLRAYALQDAGADTVDAQHALGLPVDSREYGAAAAILHDLRVDTLRLMTHNPGKVQALVEGGITIAEVVTSQPPTAPEAAFYLRTKRERLGHTTLADSDFTQELT